MDYALEWGNESFRWLLLAVPVLIGLYLAHSAWKRRVQKKLAQSLWLRRRLVGQVSGRKQAVQFAFVCIALTCAIIALARPQWGEEQKKVTREGIDIVVALDVSKSMLAADANPSRLRAAKDEVIRVLRKLHGDRVGLVVFTGISFAQSPLTSDYGAIEFYLKRLSPDDMPVGGTASGRAIRDAVELLTGESLSSKRDRSILRDQPAFKRAKTQIIVLISDGEDHQGDPVAVAKMARSKGISVYTVGFGSADGEKIPVFDDEGKLTGYKRDRQGKTVYTRLNEATLEEIASVSGGRYYHYRGRGTVASAITQTLNKLEKEAMATQLRVAKKDRFMWMLIPALFFFFLACILGQRRGLHLLPWKKLRKRRMPDEGRPALSLLLLLPATALLAGLGQGCDTLHETLVVEEVPDVQRGNKLVAAGKGDEAVQSYKSAEREIPATPELHYDLGVGHLAAGQFEDAVTELSRAVESSDLNLRFSALFNLGIAYFRQEKWQEALEAFKGALQIKPADNEAKLAFEVTLAKVYPPCSALEDDLEDNDDPSTASQLAEPSAKERTLCGGDDDWYAVPVYPGSIIRFEVVITRLREKEPGDGPLFPEPESVRALLFAADRETVIGVASLREDDDPEPDKDASTDGDEDQIQIGLGPLKLTSDMLKVPAPMGEENAVPAFIRITADEPLEYKYDLEIAVIPPCFALEDEYEDNDTLETAKPLEPTLQQNLHICKDDEEWFTHTIQPGDALFIDVVAGTDLETNTIPQLEVSLLDESGQTSVSEVERVETPQGPLWGVGIRDVEEPTTVVLKIKGFENQQQGPYQVRVYHYPPCPEGDDRLEENDQPQAASDFPVAEGHVRHLRLCPQDSDYLSITAKKDDKISLGIRYDETANDAGVADPVIFRLLDEAGSTIVSEGVAVDVAPPVETPVNRAVATEKLEEDKKFILEIASDLDDARFYDIVPMSDNSQSQPPPPEPQDGEGENDEGDEEQEEDEQESAETRPDDQEAEEEEEEEGEDEAQPEPTEEEKEAELEKLEEILENLEETDDNFQLKKALKGTPNRYIENDW